jgi:hypothetical protein
VTPAAAPEEQEAGKHMVVAARANWPVDSGTETDQVQVCARAGRVAGFGGALLLTLTLALPAQAATLYRYINDKGYQEIGYSVPNHLVPNGYDVIDDSGRLIRRVAPQLSEEEYAAKLERERKLEACEKAVERVHRRYETLADIDKAEALFETQLAESLKNAQANLDYTYSELAKQQEQAASLERSGKMVPKNLLKAMDDTQVVIANLTAQIDNGKRSREEKAADFNEERRVFQLADCDESQLASAH